MNTKSDLVVFSRKEVVLITLVVLVLLLLAFTFGVKLGKHVAKEDVVLVKPLQEELAKEMPATTTSPVPVHEGDAGHHNGVGDASSAGHTPTHASNPEAPHAAADHSSHDNVPSESHADAQANADASAHSAPGAHDVSASAHSTPTVAKSEPQSTQALVAAALKDTQAAFKKRSAPAPSSKSVEYALPKNAEKSAQKFTLQAGSHRSAAEANEQIVELKKNGFEAHVIEAHVAGKGLWYRVGVGNYTTREQAEAALQELRQRPNAPTLIIQQMK